MELPKFNDALLEKDNLIKEQHSKLLEFKKITEEYKQITRDQQEKISKLISIKKKLSILYIVIPSIVVVNIIITIVLFIMKSLILLIIHLIISFPIITGSLVIFAIKLYRDRRKISDWFISKFSTNYLIARFFTDNKKLITKKVMVRNSEFLFQGGVYIVDESCIFSDLEKNPNAFYKLNIPNPLKFNFFKYLNIYKEAEDKRMIFDDKGDQLDLSYSSDGLQKFKQDKLFNEFHSSMQDKAMMGLAISIMVFSVIIVILILVFK